MPDAQETGLSGQPIKPEESEQLQEVTEESVTLSMQLPAEENESSVENLEVEIDVPEEITSEVEESETSEPEESEQSTEPEELEQVQEVIEEDVTLSIQLPAEEDKPSVENLEVEIDVPEEITSEVDESETQEPDVPEVQEPEESEQSTEPEELEPVQEVIEEDVTLSMQLPAEEDEFPVENSEAEIDVPEVTVPEVDESETQEPEVPEVQEPEESEQLTEPEELEPVQEVEVIEEDVTLSMQLPAEEDEFSVENSEAEIDISEEITSEVNMLIEEKMTKDAVLSRLRIIVEEDTETVKDEVDALKRNFYKLRKAEIEELKKLFVENGGEEKDFVLEEDAAETELKELLNIFKEKRTAFLDNQEKEKEKNFKRKEELIEEIKNLTESSTDINKAYNEFKRIQQEWVGITLIPQTKVNEIWRSYQVQVEKFYDLVKINNEFRDYDFKKNLEAKTLLSEAAEKLADEPDVVSAFYQLQNLHQQWREIGPVAREQREEIWNRFKAASTVINKKHQGHFEVLRGNENKNLEEKTLLCEIVELIDTSLLKSFKEWNDKTKDVLECQAKWKTIGFAPKKVNEKIFERFRLACDQFFQARGEFHKGVKSELSDNYEKKKALCEKAEALKDSDDWKSTSDVLISMQKEWKTIGAVPRKHSDTLWSRFIAACDYFFEQKNTHVSSEKQHETENLARKREIIEKIRNLSEISDNEEALQTLRALAKDFSEAGHVPFKEKDKIYKEYHAELDKQFDRLNVDRASRRLSSYKDSLRDISDTNKNRLFRERDKLYKTYEILKNEIQTYENNIGFLSASSKNAGSLLKDMENKINKLKEELELIADKIEAIDERMKD